MMQELIDALLMQAQEYLKDQRFELYRRTMDEVARLKKRQEELRKEQTQAHEQTH